MLSIAESWSASSRLAVARNFLLQYPAPAEVLIVGASRSAADDLVRESASLPPATFGIYRLGFTELAARLAAGRLAEKDTAPTTLTGEQAVVWRAIFQAVNESGIPHFSKLADRVGFARSVTRTLRELRLCQIPQESIAAPGPLAAEVAEIFRMYQVELERDRIVDRATLFQTATDTIRDGSAGRYVGLPILLLDVPIGSTVERDFVAELCARALRALATVPTADERTLAALASIPGNEHRLVTADSNEAPYRLQRYIFTDVPPGHSGRDEHICFLSAPGEGRECVEIARRVLDEARRGFRFDQIAIAVRAPDVYAAVLEAALERAGIPAYFALGTRRPDPAGRAFLSLLTCASEGLSAKRFAEYLSLAQVPQLDPSGAPPSERDVWVAPGDEVLAAALPERAELLPDTPPEADDEDSPVLAGSLRAPWRWEELLVEAAVIGGAARWRRRLNGLETEIRTHLREVMADEADSGRARSLQRQLRDLQHLSNFALPVIDMLAALPASSKWGDWIKALEKLVPMVLRRPERVLELLAELRPMADIGPVPLEEVRQVLSDRLAQLQAEPPRRRYGRVFVGVPEQMRGRSFEVVFVPGLAERIFPQRPHEDPILLDQVRKRIAADHSGLRTQSDRVVSERLQLRLAVGAARERIYFSYPRFEVAMARPRVPSFYALEAKRTLAGTVPGVDQFEQESAEESQALLAWPAPPKPEQAIDDFEHDLATLWPLLREDPARVTGRANYLLQLNACLGRSLRGRYAQWRPRWTPADGLCVATQEVQAVLARHRLTARPYSPTALQHFSTCPYRFVLSAIHRLEPRQEPAPVQYLDPLTKGSIVHAILARFVRDALEQHLFPLSVSSLERAYVLLDAALDVVEQDFREQIAPAIQRIWRDEMDRVRADLRGWLVHSAEAPDGFVPVLVEFAFGLPVNEGRDPQSTETPATLPDGYQLRGIVDCVERSMAGGTLRVTDYKTGKNRMPPGAVVNGGETLQTVLYPLALQALGLGAVEQARLAYCTADGNFSQSVIKLDAGTSNTADEVLRTIDHAIAVGFLPPAPRKDACEWCDFQLVCGPYAELRAQQYKDQEPLEPLQALRELR